MTNSIQEAADIIKNGGIIAHLTDTIWGIACDPKNEEAVEKINTIKQRPPSKSFIILISNPEQLYNYVEKIPEIAWDIIEFAEEPLTVIYPKGKNLPQRVIADDGSIAIRLVKEGECFELLKKLRNGLISTSANLSGQTSPSNFSEIDSSILNAMDYIVNSNSNTKRKASKIIKLELDGGFKIIRN
jgi:L-threonylcarbamoyladenylate synthase